MLEYIKPSCQGPKSPEIFLHPFSLIVFYILHNYTLYLETYLHPPYHNIIRFSEDPQDLSNRSTVDDFLNDLKRIGEKSFKVLDKGRFLVLVIGDKYESRNLIPLGFLSMNAMMQENNLYCLYII